MAVSDIEQAVKKHMRDQPYSCVCGGCGKQVDLDIEIDGDMDMRIIVPVCECAEQEDD